MAAAGIVPFAALSLGRDTTDAARYGIFLTDILINFRTVYYDDDQELVLDHKLIRKRYMKGWFWLDLCVRDELHTLCPQRTDRVDVCGPTYTPTYSNPLVARHGHFTITTVC